MGPPEHRTALLILAIQRHGEPCVLALDELERLSEPDSLSLLNFLLKWGPPNLHIAIACREFPARFDIAQPVLDGQAVLFRAGDLRFSKSDVLRFFEPGLTRREGTSLSRESGGWPIALRILHNERGQKIGSGGTGRTGGCGKLGEFPFVARPFGE